MKATYESVMNFIACEVEKEVNFGDDRIPFLNHFDELGLNRQLDNYLKELKTRIAERWEGLE